ncbi:MAG: type III restriction-modification system endonuclease [Flexibacter sp. CG_4_10_14_3_um_filter_32_15]|nr:MAG: type III restriction-modification system endonuclease [Flexibacter sp. CG_4_10_14_3_um_filter_32_15]
MKKFNFEKNLHHQTHAVESLLSIFQNLEITEVKGIENSFVNPCIQNKFSGRSMYEKNLYKAQKASSIETKKSENLKSNSSILDIMMETGTGKTYTYTKAIFELNKMYGLFKFIIIVPTLSIKAGTINFIKSESSREHFREQYQKAIKLHVVESQKKGKSKKSYMPQAVSEFVRSEKIDKNNIQVLLINAGMLNSETMQKSYDRTLIDKYTTPFDGLAATQPFLIIDEPHRFSQENKTWKNIELLKAQFTLRMGATFTQFDNLIYQLTAVRAFNDNLVKGVTAHIERFEQGEDVLLRLINTDGKEATFELQEKNNKKSIKIAKKESFQKAHAAMTGLFIEKLNKSEVVLSNGLSLKKGDKINPYSYSETLQERLIKKAVQNHFKLEKELLTREVRIKPLTLFFIDNIEEYRNEKGTLKILIEQAIKTHAEELLKNETDPFYQNYLQKTLDAISLTHGGYFSKDNKDETVEKEVNEILHDKEAMLSLENPRRFIFSKWTLREGWDNPNVFQICKLRSSGSEISKLQEVGRGLRLPVNEHMHRVKNEQFYLHYFVDFTETDFVDNLINEINKNSDAISLTLPPEKFNEKFIKKILEMYPDKFKNSDALLEYLDENNVINRSNNFKEKGFEFIKKEFPLIFDGIDSTKIRKAEDTKQKVRVEKYAQLKELWEEINQKAILEYKIETEEEFKKLFIHFLKQEKRLFIDSNLHTITVKLEIENQRAQMKEVASALDNKIMPFVTISYTQFLKELAQTMNINIQTLHASFKVLKTEFDINLYRNTSTIRAIKQYFDQFLLYNSIDKFGIAYQKVSSSIHPTKLTNSQGTVLEEVLSSDIGILKDEAKVADNYFFEDLFYDSKLERENSISEIDEVIVFTKIPKNSIKIPISGGKTYSPDFAYVVKHKEGNKKLYFVVETKDTDEKQLRNEELQKIKHAEKFFDHKIKIQFKTQFSHQKMNELIREIYQKN